LKTLPIGDLPILTKSGYSEMNAIKTGEMVLTHKNLWKRVLKVESKPNINAVRISVTGSLDLKTLENSLFYTIRPKFDGDQIIDDGRIWRRTSDINNMDYLATPIIQHVSNDYNLSKNECYILGMYLINGYITNKDGMLKKVISKNPVQKIVLPVDHIRSPCINFPHTIFKCDGKAEKMLIRSESLVSIAIHDCGTLHDTKYISQTLLGLPEKHLQYIFNGMVKSGGTLIDSVWEMRTKSRNLANTAALLVAKAFHTKLFIKQLPDNSYLMSLNNNPKYEPQEYFVSGDHIWSKFLGSSSAGESQFTILTVEDDHSYVLNNMVVRAQHHA